MSILIIPLILMKTIMDVLFTNPLCSTFISFSSFLHELSIGKQTQILPTRNF